MFRLKRHFVLDVKIGLACTELRFLDISAYRMSHTFDVVCDSQKIEGSGPS